MKLEKLLFLHKRTKATKEAQPIGEYGNLFVDAGCRLRLAVEALNEIKSLGEFLGLPLADVIGKLRKVARETLREIDDPSK